MVFVSNVKNTIVEALSNENYIVTPSEDSILSGSDDKELAIKIGELALAEVNLYKNTYNVTMFNYIDKVKGYIEGAKVLGISSKYSIMETSKPETLKILEEQGYFKDAGEFVDIGRADIVIPCPIDVANYIYSQDATIIPMIEAVKTKFDNESLSKIWSSILSNVTNSNSDIDSLLYGGLGNVDKCIVLIGFIDYIIEKAVVGDMSISSAQTDVLRDLKYNIFVALKRMSSSYDKNVESGLLITSVVALPNGITNIYVDAGLYETFLNDGGSVECLLGFFISKFVSPTNFNNISKEILEDKVRHEAEFKEAIRVDNIRRSLELNKNAINFYSIALSELFRDFSDEAKNLYVPNVNVADGILDEIINSKNSHDQLNVEQVSYELFRGIAIMPNYVKFMDFMSSISNENPDLDPKECASLAFVDLVLSYVLDQLCIKKYNKIQGTIEPSAIVL